MVLSPRLIGWIILVRTWAGGVTLCAALEMIYTLDGFINGARRNVACVHLRTSPGPSTKYISQSTVRFPMEFVHVCGKKEGVAGGGVGRGVTGLPSSLLAPSPPAAPFAAF